MTASLAVQLARRGASIVEIAKQAEMTVAAATAIAGPIGKQRIKDTEAIVYDLLALCDTAIQQQALAFRELRKMAEEWDKLSVKLAAIATRADTLINGNKPPKPPKLPRVRKRKPKATQ